MRTHPDWKVLDAVVTGMSTSHARRSQEKFRGDVEFGQSLDGG
jgi:hypothetical protein